MKEKALGYNIIPKKGKKRVKTRQVMMSLCSMYLAFK
jgi:hypothetical protein